MKTIVLLFFLTFALAAAESIEDLGQVTSRRGIALTACENRADFLEFRIVFFPQTPLKNPVSLTTTNDLLLLADLAQLPSGPTIMGVQSVCKDSAESPIAFYKFEIIRSDPSPPKAKAIAILVPEQRQSATNLLKQIKRKTIEEAANNLPPTPGQTNALPDEPWEGPALPYVLPKTYGEHLDEMSRYYDRKSRK